MAGAGTGRELDADAAKAQAAREVCAASAAFASCPHRRRRSPRGGRPHFVDWYLVLAIGEAASEDAVRRRYRQLGKPKIEIRDWDIGWSLLCHALQTDDELMIYLCLFCCVGLDACSAAAAPGQEQAPQGGGRLQDRLRAHAWQRALMESVADRLAVPVPPGQYAHACLTDRSRRRAFDADRRASFCATCHDRHAARSSAAATGGARLRATSDKQMKPAGRSKQPRAVAAPTQALRDMQNRMREECRVIDGCLKANDAAACARRRQSFPLFDPSDHRRRFPDYPHVRPPPVTPFGTSEFWWFDERLARADQNIQNQRWCRGGGESPVYQIRKAAAECTERTKRAW
ncbi:hypothetical protein HU200_010939 [Digitaria exilis]|uniref:J domain-containing protein n=1 Tax=Digitaria exilis TaxID=1010633 RepID=A0A835KPJ5_9POAL|nr:hypothetical protein HU200_010939 [Digitaria exilis]